MPRSTRPVVKIGLIAPFEGLYRRAGYEALAAAQMAVDDHTAGIDAAGVDLLIQALDDTAQVKRSTRASEKLLADPAVGAVVGPLASWLRQALPTGTTGQTLPAGEMVRREGGAVAGPFIGVPWGEPALWGGSVEGIGTDDPLSQSRLVEAVATTMAGNDGSLAGTNMQRLLVGGMADLVLPSNELIAIEFWRDGVAFLDGDALLWLGSPADGAAVVNELRLSSFDGPIWFGSWGGDPVLWEHLDSTDAVYWAIWQDSHYTKWAESHNLASPFAYLVYKTTERAIWYLINSRGGVSTSMDELLGETHGSDNEWQVVFYEIGGDGISRPLEP